jgi:hypothetical protein
VTDLEHHNVSIDLTGAFVEESVCVAMEAFENVDDFVEDDQNGDGDKYGVPVLTLLAVEACLEVFYPPGAMLVCLEVVFLLMLRI